MHGDSLLIPLKSHDPRRHPSLPCGVAEDVHWVPYGKDVVVLPALSAHRQRDAPDRVLSAVAEAFADMEFSTVDGIRVRYDDGWCLCRASNTEAILVMRAEGRTEAALETILADVNVRLGQMLDLSTLH